MKVMFIDAKIDVNLDKVHIDFQDLPNNSGLITTLQYKHLLEKLEVKIQEHKKKCKNLGIIIGCNQDIVLDQNVDSFVYIGTGRFHPLGIAAKTNKEVYCLNPHTGNVTLISKEEVQKFIKKKYLAKSLFLTKEKIGIIYSLKKGQSYKNIFELKNKIKEKYPTKKVYVFVCDTLDFNDLENFTYIDLWINTMCPRIAHDDSKRIQKPVVNAEDLEI